MKLLITGAAGFIGSTLALRLLARGERRLCEMGNGEWGNRKSGIVDSPPSRPSPS